MDYAIYYGFHCVHGNELNTGGYDVICQADTIGTMFSQQILALTLC